MVIRSRRRRRRDDTEADQFNDVTEDSGTIRAYTAFRVRKRHDDVGVGSASEERDALSPVAGGCSGQNYRSASSLCPFQPEDVASVPLRCARQFCRVRASA